MVFRLCLINENIMVYQSNIVLLLSMNRVECSNTSSDQKPSCSPLFELDCPAQAKLSCTLTMLLLTALVSADNSPPAANATHPSFIFRYFFFFLADGKYPKGCAWFFFSFIFPSAISSSSAQCCFNSLKCLSPCSCIAQ